MNFIWANIMNFLVFAGGIGLIFDWFYDLKKSLSSGSKGARL